MKRRAFLAGAMTILLPASVCRGQAAEPLRIGVSENSIDQRISAMLLQVVYDRLGIPVRFVSVPARRVMVEAGAGRLDGLAHRIGDIGDEFPALVRVPTPVSHLESVLFTNKPDLFITDLSTIRNYRIAIRRGAVHAEQLTAGMPNVLAVATPTDVMRLLQAGHVDLVLLSGTNGNVLARQLKMEQVHRAAAPLNTQDLYHFLHNRHIGLVPEVDRILNEMTRSGELDMLRETFAEDMLRSVKAALLIPAEK